MEKQKVYSDHRYSSFLFLKLDDKYRHMMSNERIAAKQELETLVACRQDEIFLRTYSLYGLKAGADMLLWLVSPELMYIQKAWAQFSTTGAGKYFSVAQSYLGLYQLAANFPKKEMECGVVPKDLFGKFRYMLLHPLTRTHEWYELSMQEREKFQHERSSALAKYPLVTEHFFSSYGLDDQEHIVVRESNNIEDLAMASRELREQRIKMFTKCATPNMLCVGRDLREILDSLG